MQNDISVQVSSGTSTGSALVTIAVFTVLGLLIYWIAPVILQTLAFMALILVMIFTFGLLMSKRVRRSDDEKETLMSTYHASSARKVHEAFHGKKTEFQPLKEDVYLSNTVSVYLVILVITTMHFIALLSFVFDDAYHGGRIVPILGIAAALSMGYMTIAFFKSLLKFGEWKNTYLKDESKMRYVVRKITTASIFTYGCAIFLIESGVL